MGPPLLGNQFCPTGRFVTVAEPSPSHREQSKSQSILNHESLELGTRNLELGTWNWATDNSGSFGRERMTEIKLRKGPDSEQGTLNLVQSENRLVVRFRQHVVGGEAAKSLLRLPFMFERRVQARQLSLPPGLAVFEVRPDEATSSLPGYETEAEEILNSTMNFIRSKTEVSISCYHTYRLAQEKSAGDAARDNEIFPSGKLFLEFNRAVAPDVPTEVFRHYGLVVDRAIVYRPGAFVVSVSRATGMNPIRLAEKLQSITFKQGSSQRFLLDYADPLLHRRRKALVVPDEPLFRFQWHLRNDGFEGGKPLADIRATEAWDYTKGLPEVIVAVIDDAFDIDHSDLGAGQRIVAPLNLTDGSRDPRPSPRSGEWHGTAVLGLIGADHNGNGSCGIAPGCRLIPIKLEALSDDDTEARAFDHAVANNAAVINCSWGPYDGYSQKKWPMPRITELAIENAFRNDVCVVFAAGNGAEEISTDGYASYQHVVAVSASTDKDERAYYSDYGEQVLICAPSSGGDRDIATTDVRSGGYNPFGGYSDTFGGTSASAPIVSGVIALMQSAYASKYPGHRLTVNRVKEILKETAERIDKKGAEFPEYWENRMISVKYKEDARGDLHSVAYGYGRVNAASAVKRVLREPPPKKALSQETSSPPSAEGTVGTDAIRLEPHVVGDPLRRFGRLFPSEEKKNERFESGEHIWIGERGFKDACLESNQPYDRSWYREDRSESFSYGELVALSGDFYGSPNDLYFEKPSLLPWACEENDLSDLKKAFQSEVDAIQEQMVDSNVSYPDNNITYWWNAKYYIELALKNAVHFGWNNMVAYCRHHNTAMHLARQSLTLKTSDSVKSERLWRHAVFTNAFADHFLTDGFAAGHIRVPRREIIEWGERKKLSSKVTGALSKLLHDQDGHRTGFHGTSEHRFDPDDPDGLMVINSRGEEWWTRCDGQLFSGKTIADPAIKLPVQAVKQSVAELLEAYTNGDLPEGVYQATYYVPFPHPDKEPSLSKKFSSSMSQERLDLLMKSTKWYTRIPYIVGLDEDHVKMLFHDMPEIMKRFCRAVKSDLKNTPDLKKRLPSDYQDAYTKMG